MRISAHTRTFCDKHNDYCGPRSLRQLRDSSTARMGHSVHDARRKSPWSSSALINFKKRQFLSFMKDYGKYN